MRIGNVMQDVNKVSFLTFCLVLGGFWCWNWIVFQSPVDQTVFIGGGANVSVPCRLVSLLVFALISLGIFVIERSESISLPVVPIWVRIVSLCVIVAIIVVCDVMDGSYDGVPEGTVGSYLTGCLIGVAGVALYLSWASFVADLGRARFRLMILACILSCVFGSLCSFAFYYAHESVRQSFVLVFLATSFPLLHYYSMRSLFKGDYDQAHRPVSVNSHIPVKFVITLFVLGVALSLMQCIFVLVNSISDLGPLASLGSILAAAAVALCVFAFNFDFNRLLYQVGYPLMAWGFILFLVCGSELLGYALSVAGYRFCEIVAWVLCVYLISRIRASAMYLFALLAGSLALGQAAGLLILGEHAVDFVMQISLIAIAILFMSALLLVTSKGTQESWGIVRLKSRDGGRSSEEALLTIAVDSLLTPRETEVFLLLALGRNKRTISRDLVLSENTVKTHIAKIYQKIDVHSQQELIDVIEKRTRAGQKDAALDDSSKVE